MPSASNQDTVDFAYRHKGRSSLVQHFSLHIRMHRHEAAILGPQAAGYTSLRQAWAVPEEQTQKQKQTPWVRESGALHGPSQQTSFPVSFKSSSAAWTTSSTEIVSSPASGSARREWSRLLCGFRSTRNLPPKGPLRAGSVGP